MFVIRYENYNREPCCHSKIIVIEEKVSFLKPTSSRQNILKSFLVGRKSLTVQLRFQIEKK